MSEVSVNLNINCDINQLISHGLSKTAVRDKIILPMRYINFLNILKKIMSFVSDSILKLRNQIVY